MNRLLQIHPRFMRSVHLERDLNDASSSLGYILTPVATNALNRICDGFHSNSTQRTFRIAGDYGSGKVLSVSRSLALRPDRQTPCLRKCAPFAVAANCGPS